jgi:hypothetical protein
MAGLLDGRRHPAGIGFKIGRRTDEVAGDAVELRAEFLRQAADFAHAPAGYYRPAYYGGYAPAYYGGYGYDPYPWGGYTTTYYSTGYAPAYYGYRYRRVVRPAYAYYGTPFPRRHFHHHRWHHRW